MSETWLQATARNLVFQDLKRLRNGSLTITTKYTSGSNEIVPFGSSSSESDPQIVVTIKNPQVFI